MKRTTLVILSSSPVIAIGLTAALRGMADGNLSVVESTAQALEKTVTDRGASVVMAETWLLDEQIAQMLRDNGVRIIGLQLTVAPPDVVKRFDDMVSVYDPVDIIRRTVTRNLPTDSTDEKQRELSPREKDVIVGVVKGLSNKEIAEQLNVSAHTVMTHRRNIASKLQIHSPAGLTIYAIVSNLVDLNDIKSGL